MSEEILTAIIQLLAIVAKEDEITTDEIASTENYLHDNLTEETAKRYLRLFNEYCESLSYTTKKETEIITEICEKINKEQTAQQKAVIILNLIILIASDGVISQREMELLYLISDKINIEKDVTDLIKAFVIYQERSKLTSPDVLIIDDGSREVPERCKHLISAGLDGFVFILRIPGIEVFLAKYIGEHGLLLNSAPMRTNHIYNLPVGSVIKIPRSSSIFFSEIVSTFKQASFKNPVTLVAQSLTYKFKSGKVGLRNINLEEEGGRLIALMGGSGAGKSTLLNVLNGNEKPSEGIVRINGIDIHTSKKQIDGVIGYVPQDDLLIEELTVFDNLYYAAKLCFKDLDHRALTELVEKTLNSLGLFETKKLKVGSPLDKTISGGQRKRLNIGLELLREPSVLFVDEPTSGLSSRDSENIMDLLKELSLKGKMIFVVIHQPSEDIFKMFDRLLILDVGGYQVYYGNPIEGIGYFKEQVKMVEQTSNTNPELLFNIIESKVVDEYGRLTKHRKTTPYQWYQLFKEKITIPRVKETSEVPHKTLNIPGKLRQLGIFTIRDLKAKLGNKQYLVINLLEAPVLALLLAYMVRYVHEDVGTYFFSENPNIPVFFFMSVVVALFMGLTVSAEEIIKDRKILKRESFLNLSKMSYLWSKLIILFSLSGIQTLTFVLIGSWILEIRGMLWPFWLVLFSISCFANVLGLNVSSAFKSAITVYILIPLLVIPQLVLSGVVVNFDKLNPSITTRDKVPIIGELMASRWAFEGLVVTQFQDNAYEARFFADNKSMAEAEYKTSYLLPRLLGHLEEVSKAVKTATPEQQQALAHKLEVVKNEFDKELAKIGKDKYPDINKLTIEKFDEQVFKSATEFAKKLMSYYNERYKHASREKQSIIRSLTATEMQMDQFTQLRKDHENEAVAMLVKNLGASHRMVEHNNELIQKIYPIYQDPALPDGMFDFRTQFYLPQKHFAGLHIDTLVFNVIIIWLMSLVLFITLYFDLPRKIVSGTTK